MEATSSDSSGQRSLLKAGGVSAKSQGLASEAEGSAMQRTCKFFRWNECPSCWSGDFPDSLLSRALGSTFGKRWAGEVLEHQPPEGGMVAKNHSRSQSDFKLAAGKGCN